jgi:hypothetical protein
MEVNKIYPIFMKQLESSAHFLFEYSKGNRDLAIIDFFIDFIKILKNDQSLQSQINYQNAPTVMIEFTLYFCEKQEIKLSIQQKQELQSTLKKLVTILGDDMLMNNLNKSRFKLW